MARSKHNKKLSQSKPMRHDSHRLHHQMERGLLTPQLLEFSPSLDYSMRTIVAIDIGTHSCYVRYKLSGEKDTYAVDRWYHYDINDSSGSAQIPTVTYYPINGGTPIWGRAVELEREANPNFDDGRVVYFWKLALNPDSNMDPSLRELQHRAAKDFVRLLLEYLFNDHDGYFVRLGGKFQLQNVSLIFTKPSSWPKSRYLIFQDVALEKGFQQWQMDFVSETEAQLSSYCMEYIVKNLPSFRKGYSLLNVDAGGGTIDLDVHEISDFEIGEPERLRFRPLGPCSMSLKNGSETVTEAFVDILRPQLIEAGYQAHEVSEMVNQARREFNRVKKHFSGTIHNPYFGNQETWDLSIPKLRENKRRGWKNGRYLLSTKLILQLFDFSVDACISGIDQLLDLCPRLPEVMVIGGGYSCFYRLRSRLLQTYDSEGCNRRIPIRWLKETKPVVAKGAIHMRQHIDFLQYRLIRESYAIPLLCEYKLMKASFPNVDWKPIDDPLEQNPLVIANEWFVKQGDHVGANVKFELDKTVHRRMLVQKTEDLYWVQELVVFEGHPGDKRYTPLFNGQRDCTTGTENGESFRTEDFVVDLRKEIKYSSLPNIIRKKIKYYYLDFCFSVEMDVDTPHFFIQFQQHKQGVPHDLAPWKKKRIYQSKFDFATIQSSGELSGLERDISNNPKFDLAYGEQSNLVPVTEDHNGEDTPSEHVLEIGTNGNIPRSSFGTPSAQLARDCFEQVEHMATGHSGEDRSNFVRHLSYASEDRSIFDALREGRSILDDPEAANSTHQQEMPATPEASLGIRARPRRPSSRALIDHERLIESSPLPDPPELSTTPRESPPLSLRPPQPVPRPRGRPPINRGAISKALAEKNPNGRKRKVHFTEAEAEDRDYRGSGTKIGDKVLLLSVPKGLRSSHTRTTRFHELP